MDVDVVAQHLLAGTRRAATSCLDWVGRGDGTVAARIAGHALRGALAESPVRGRVTVIDYGQGPAPTLEFGETIGRSGRVRVDLAVRPLEIVHEARNGAAEWSALTVAAAAPVGTLLTSPGWYLDKWVVRAQAARAISMTDPVEQTARRVASALGKPVDRLRVLVLDRPRHHELIARLHDVGCRVTAVPGGEVLAALRVLRRQSDVLVGIGGVSEGLLIACAARCLGGAMQAALAPQSTWEQSLLDQVGQVTGRILTLEELVPRRPRCFAVTRASRHAGGVTTTTTAYPDGRRVWSYLCTPTHWYTLRSPDRGTLSSASSTSLGMLGST